jgi:hypothetical protein
MRKGILVLAVAWLTAPAGADDGAASLAAGGIVFTSGTPVRMQAEDLYISPKKVRVRFEFFNPTKQDITTVVAFPLPDLDGYKLGLTTNIGATKTDPVNFVGFSVVVDGQARPFRTEQRAFWNGRDVTSLVAGAGMPLNLMTDGGYHAWERALKRMPPQQRSRLAAANIIEEDTGYPNWTTRTRFYWTQVFPAGKTVVIEHTYQPVSGSWNERRGLFDDPKIAKMFCAEANTLPRVNKLTGSAYQTQYVLKTAKTWNGSIGRFHLTLDKLKPGNVLSLCWDGALKRTSPTTFEFTARDYVPVRDIDMAVLE